MVLIGRYLKSLRSFKGIEGLYILGLPNFGISSMPKRQWGKPSETYLHEKTKFSWKITPPMGPWEYRPDYGSGIVGKHNTQYDTY